MDLVKMMEDPVKRHGINGYLKIIDLFSSPSGMPSAIDLVGNKLIVLAPGAVVGEAIGITKAGRSERLRDLAERLMEDEKIEDVLGRKPVVTIFKPNSLAKNLYHKDPDKRALFHEFICNLHRNALLEMSMPPRQNVAIVETDVALFDRGSYDDIFWSYALREADLIRDNKMKEALEISGRSIREKLVHIVFGINVPFSVSLEREKKRGGGYGTVMNPEFLSILHESYMRAEREDRIRKGLLSSYNKGDITQEDYKEQIKNFLVQVPYISINGLESKETNSDKIFYPFRDQILYNHGVSEELEYLVGR